MRVLVTGATGFLGGRLARRLSGEGRDVIAMGRDPAALERLAAEGIAVAGAGAPTPPFDAAVHCAGLSAPAGRWRDFEAANVATTDALVAAARGTGKRIVMVSTPAVYWRPEDQFDLPEDTPLPPPVSHYAASKRRAEKRLCAAEGISPVILRPRALYGRGDTALLPRLARAAAAGPLPRLRGGGAVTDLTHVDDAVAACVAALDVPDPGAPLVCNVSGGEARKITEVIAAVCARRGIPLRWRDMPLAPAMTAARAMAAFAALSGREPRATPYSLGVLAYSQTLDISRAAARLGWTPRIGFADGFEEAMLPA